MSLNLTHWTFKSILHPKLILQRDLSPEHAKKKKNVMSDILARNDVNLSEVLHQTGTSVHQIFDLKCAGSGAPIRTGLIVRRATRSSSMMFKTGRFRKDTAVFWLMFCSVDMWGKRRTTWGRKQEVLNNIWSCHFKLVPAGVKSLNYECLNGYMMTEK